MRNSNSVAAELEHVRPHTSAVSTVRNSGKLGVVSSTASTTSLHLSSATTVCSSAHGTADDDDESDCESVSSHSSNENVHNVDTNVDDDDANASTTTATNTTSTGYDSAAAGYCSVLEPGDLSVRRRSAYSIVGSDAYALVDDERRRSSLSDSNSLSRSDQRPVVDDDELSLYSSCTVSSAYFEASRSSTGHHHQASAAAAIDPYDRPTAASSSSSTTTQHQQPREKASLASLRHESDRDWTNEWFALLDAPLLQRGERMRALTSEFAAASEALVRRIVDERGLPLERKTLRPISGGVAGGEKMFWDGIFAKYAVDLHGVFGGSDHNAMKAAALEKKGLQAFMSLGLDIGLNFALMSVVDYAGFRIVTMSTLPISNGTLRYGSADGGATVHRSHEPLAELIDQICAWLNLKPHDVNGTTLSAPFDLEGHVSADGQFFAIDFARTFPPERPNQQRGAVFYRQLRPEFCRRWRIPLCSDAFTRFASPQDNREVRHASHFLRAVLVPQFARELLGAAAPPSTESGVLQACVELCRNVHFVGLNIRHLGPVCTALTALAGDAAPLVAPKRVLLLEMIARVVKNRLRALWRALPALTAGAHFRRVFDYLSLVFDAERGDENAFFWRVELKLALATEFEYALTPRETSETWDVRDDAGGAGVDFVRALFRRVSTLAGFSFEVASFDAFLDAVRRNAYALMRLHATSKPFSIGSRLEADCLVEIARKSGATPLSEAAREQLYELSFAKYEEVLQQNTDELSCVVNYALALHRYAKLMSNKGARDVADAHFARSQALLLSAFELLGLPPLSGGPTVSTQSRRVSSLRGLFHTSGDVPDASSSTSTAATATTTTTSSDAHPDSYRAFRVLLLLGNSYLAHAISRNAGVDAARRAAAPSDDAPPAPPVGMLRRTLAMSSLQLGDTSASSSSSASANTEAVLAQLRSAAELYERAAQLEHSDNLLLLNWAYAHQLQGQLSEANAMAMLHFNEAVRLYHAAIKLTPESPVAAKRMGISYLERVGWLRSRAGPPGESAQQTEAALLGIAERAFLDAERIEEGSAAFYLGCVAAIRHDESEARAWLEKAMRLARSETLPTPAEVTRSEWLSFVRTRAWFISWCAQLLNRSQK
jgi:tetratricopeptide (TPR) repeat protein